MGTFGSKHIVTVGQVFLILAAAVVTLGVAYVLGGHWCALVSLIVGVLAAKYQLLLIDWIALTITVAAGTVLGSRLPGAAEHLWLTQTLTAAVLGVPAGIFVYLMVEECGRWREEYTEELRRRDDYE